MAQARRGGAETRRDQRGEPLETLRQHTQDARDPLRVTSAA